MSLNGIVPDWIGYMQAIIYFILAVYLIYLTMNTKLTHVDEFRKKFVLAILILIGSVSIYVVCRNFFHFSEQFYEILLVILFIGLFCFILAMLLSYRTLVEYVSDIIELEYNNKKEISKALLISVIIDMIFFVTILISNIVQYIWIELVIGRVIFIGFFFSAVYTFELHLKMKNANINVMIYFGFGFLSFGFLEFVSLFVNLIKTELGWALVNFIVSFMLAIFIIGYLSFKRHILTNK